MKKLWILPSVLFFSCGGNGTSEPAPVIGDSSLAVVAPPTTNPIQGCYLSVSKKDTARLSLHINDGAVSGTLSYDYEEKDDNSGIITGILKEDLIVANYTFASEGKSSVRQVVFKVGVNQLLEGFGESEAKGDSSQFRNIPALQYETNAPFNKVVCR